MKKIYHITGKVQIAHTEYTYADVEYDLEVDDEDVPFEDFELPSVLATEISMKYYDDNDISDSDLVSIDQETLQYTDLTPY